MGSDHFAPEWSLASKSFSKQDGACVHFCGSIPGCPKWDFAIQICQPAIVGGCADTSSPSVSLEKFSEVLAPLLHALGRDLTFTGRSEIWTHITLETVNPIYGSGFWNFWGGPGGTRVNEAMHGVIPNAHNGYMDMYLDGGFIALALLYFMLIVCGQKMGSSSKSGAIRRTSTELDLQF